MKRDGKNRSIWQDTVELSAIKQPASTKTDIIIIGGGITGLTAALRLQAEGKSCIILEAHRIGFGTTGGTSAHLNTVLDTPYSDIIQLHGEDKAQQVVESTRDAINIIRENIDRYHIDCDFTPCSGFMYAENEEEHKELDDIYDALQTLGIPVNKVPEVPLPVDVLDAIQFEEQARFHPTRYLAGLLRSYLQLGGQVVEGALVQQVDKKDNHIEVSIENGQKFVADYIVYATHTPPGVQILHFRIAPYRSYIQVWDLDQQSDCPKDLVYDMKEPFHYFRKVEMNDRAYLLIGGQDHKTAHDDNEESNFRELEAFVRDMFSVKDKVYQWSSQYYESQDFLPFIGYYPGKGNKRQVLATGFSGNGMIFGSLGGTMMADLILKGTCNYQELYSPGRIGPIASYKEFIQENVDVAKHFVMDRFAYEKIEGLAELSRGEGKLLQYEGDKIGLYKDEQGQLFAIDPVCRHAGCIVKWNNAEHTWDCPCHGARYSPDGKVVTGPSTAHLPQISLAENETKE